MDQLKQIKQIEQDTSRKYVVKYIIWGFENFIIEFKFIISSRVFYLKFKTKHCSKFGAKGSIFYYKNNIKNNMKLCAKKLKQNFNMKFQ